jgi:hypothetical protein
MGNKDVAKKNPIRTKINDKNETNKLRDETDTHTHTRLTAEQ